MTALILAALGALSALYLRRYRYGWTLLFLPILLFLMFYFLSSNFLGEQLIEHQRDTLLSTLHQEYSSMEKCAAILKDAPIEDRSSVEEIIKDTGFSGWWTLYGEDGKALIWNHHPLEYAAGHDPQLIWTLNGWTLTRSQKVTSGVMVMTLVEEPFEPTFGIRNILFLPVRQFAPFLKRDNSIEAVYLWKERDLPPFLQILVATDSFPTIRSKVLLWLYGESLFFLVLFLFVYLRPLPLFLPLAARLLLIPVEWDLIGVRGWMAEESSFGLELLNPLFSSTWQSLLTLSALGLFLILLKPRLMKTTWMIRTSVFIIVLLTIEWLTWQAAGNMLEGAGPFWVWILGGLILLGCSLWSGGLWGLLDLNRTDIWINGVLVLIFLTALITMAVPLLILSLALALFFLLRRRLALPLFMVTLLLLLILPAHLLREQAWKGEVELHLARRTMNQSFIQLALLNGPVQSYFKQCDLTTLFPHADYLSDWRGLAAVLAEESGLLARGALAMILIERDGREVSTFANFAIPRIDIPSSEVWEFSEEEVFGDIRPIYHARFPIVMEGRAWGQAFIRVLVSDPRIPLFLQPWGGGDCSEIHHAVYERDGHALVVNSPGFPRVLSQKIMDGPDRWIEIDGMGSTYRLRSGNSYYLFVIPQSVRYFPLSIVGFIFLLGVVLWIIKRPFPPASLGRRFVAMALWALAIFFISVVFLLMVALRHSAATIDQRVFTRKAEQLGRMVEQLRNEQVLDDPQVGYFLSRLAGSHVFLYREGKLIYSTLPGLKDFEPQLRELSPTLLTKIKQEGWYHWDYGSQSIVFLSLPGSDTQVVFSRSSEEKIISVPGWMDALAGGAFLLFGLLMGVIVSSARRIIMPLTLLTKEARDVLEGESADLSELSGPQEVVTLSSALHSMVLKLSDEKELFKVLVDNLPSAVVLLDPDDVPVLQNNTFSDLLGYTTLQDIISAKDKIEIAECEWNLQSVGLSDERKLIVLEDLTEVMKGERYEAWFRMAKIIAHEIKNPLTPMRLTVDYINEKIALDPESLKDELPQLLAEMLEQMEELNRTAIEFSDFSRITEAQKVPMDLSRAMTTWIQPFLHHERIEVAIPEKAIEIEADERLIRRSVVNIINNALQSASPSPPVAISLDSDSDHAVITVSDEGCGVPEEMLSRIFEPYFSTRVGGTGLGLAIARRIILDHGGTVEAWNREGGGLTVKCCLPLLSGS